MRSILTMLGVIIGVASVVALMAVGNGASAEITGQVEAVGTQRVDDHPGSLSNPDARASVAANADSGRCQCRGCTQLAGDGRGPQMGASASVVAAAVTRTPTWSASPQPIRLSMRWP
ncbi:ABC transporter permease [Candidatus Amarolinea dominans]|uniref:ABC transporter permease n=1 Tax=Candidatus Amarolinea dominans TaxID=3140696 RepID=UPI0031351856|nr:ABC transporter permease [Anaerolineae bacterium]